MAKEATIWGGPAAAGLVPKTAVATLQIKMPWHPWTKRWFDWPRATVRSYSGSIAAAGYGQCEFEVLYGPKYKFPHLGTGLGFARPQNFIGWWVRVQVQFEDGTTSTEFVGRVETEHREVYASTAGPAGKQTFVAFDPLFTLSKIHVSESVWWDTRNEEGVELILPRMPSMNRLTEDGALLGNRTAEVHGDPEPEVYLFGGTSLWNRAQFVEYVLGRFADEGGVNGPGWWLSGLVGPLAELEDHVKLDSAMSIGAIARRLISPRHGLDFKCRPRFEDNAMTGFELFVAALQHEAINYGTATLPANENVLELPVNEIGNAKRVEVVVSRQTKHRRIRLLGERIVMCCTLRGAMLEGGEPGLVPKWYGARETEYIAGTGDDGDDSTKHDDARKRERLASVYTRFGAPDDWDHQGKLAVPQLSPEGELLPPTGSELYQNKIRGTLQATPLKKDHAYITDEVNLNPDNWLPEFVAPMAWIRDESTGNFLRIEDIGAEIVAPYYDWGVQLTFQNTMPHVIALGHFPSSAKSTVEPKYRYETLAVTLAMHTDHRLKLEYDVPPGVPWEGTDPRPSDGVLSLEMPGMELWFMVPRTVFDVKHAPLADAGQLALYEGYEHLVLRNDAAKMHQSMAGAIARHAKRQGRALIEFEGLLNYADFVGTMLTVIDVNGALHQIKAPVTAVRSVIPEIEAGATSEEVQPPTTIVEAGYVGP